MGIQFCEKCGKILKIRIENDLQIGSCTCGYNGEIKGEISATENLPKEPEKGKGAVSGENQLATYPHDCPKCGHDKAQVIDLGVWFSDEAGVIRYRCGKCGFTQQEQGSNS